MSVAALIGLADDKKTGQAVFGVWQGRPAFKRCKMCLEGLLLPVFEEKCMKNAVFSKKKWKMFCSSKKSPTFALALQR